jgi:hypothetical protein
MLMIPEAVRQAAQKVLGRGDLLALGPAAGQPGELGVVRSSTYSDTSNVLVRFVIVVSRDETTRTLAIHLATNEVEQATDLDLIVDPERGLPFHLVLQGELYGPVFEEQLDGIATRFGIDVTDAVAAALVSDGESLSNYRSGQPLGDASDPRREFKKQELDDLEKLVAKCRSWLAGTPAANELLDPELLLPPAAGTPLEEAMGQFVELLDVIAATPENALDLPSELVTLMGEAGLLDEIARWRQDFGLDAARVLSRFTISETRLRLMELGNGDQRFAPGRRADVVLASLLRSSAESGHSTLDIRTTGRCWKLESNLAIISGPSGGHCRARFLKAA